MVKKKGRVRCWVVGEHVGSHSGQGFPGVRDMHTSASLAQEKNRSTRSGWVFNYVYALEGGY